MAAESLTDGRSDNSGDSQARETEFYRGVRDSLRTARARWLLEPEIELPANSQSSRRAAEMEALLRRPPLVNNVMHGGRNKPC
jgi:predicted nucleic acid-binding protein